jgi:plastocyanin
MSAPIGTYTFHCRIHSLMTGRITVVPASANGTSAAELAERVNRQVKADVHAGFVSERAASKGSKVHNWNGTTTWFVTAGTGSPDGRVAVLEFLPTNIKIEKGDKVVFKPREPNEPHTVTFPGELFTDLVPLCEAGASDVGATPGHTPPASPFDFKCGTQPFPDEIELGGGNGVRNVTSPTTISDSGIVATTAVRRSFGLRPHAVLTSWKVSFRGAAKGTYTYICQIHGAGMSGTIVVH